MGNGLDLLVSNERELADAWEREPLLSKGLGDFGEIFSVAETERLISAHLPISALRLFVDGKAIPPDRYARPRDTNARGGATFADPRTVLNHISRGATLALEELQTFCPQVAAFAADLAKRTGYRVDCTAFVTPAGVRGLDPHYDVASVIIRQIYGAKTWRIGLPARRWPVRRFTAGDETETPQVLKVTLEEGQSLYVPRGYLHASETGDRGSLHFTITLAGQTWGTLLREATATATAECEELREMLPPRFAQDDREALFRERLALLIARLDKLSWPAEDPQNAWTAAAYAPPAAGRLAALLSGQESTGGGSGR